MTITIINSQDSDLNRLPAPARLLVIEAEAQGYTRFFYGARCGLYANVPTVAGPVGRVKVTPELLGLCTIRKREVAR